MPSSAGSAAICSCLRLDAVVCVEVHETTAATTSRSPTGRDPLPRRTCNRRRLSEKPPATPLDRF
jgi:hypothetical protein